MPSESELRERIFVEALPRLVTRRSVETTQIGPQSTPTRPGADPLIAEAAVRHAMACGLVLQPVIRELEPNVSRVAVRHRTEAIGALQGRLDVPRYTQRRATTRRQVVCSYPVIAIDRRPNMPENRLVVSLFSMLARRLANSPFPTGSAEARLAQELRIWLARSARRSPWWEVPRGTSLERALAEAAQRVDRRQTGSDRLYGRVVAIARDLIVEGGADAAVRERMLALPTGESLWNTMFEVWCLGRIKAALEALGHSADRPARPLHEIANDEPSDVHGAVQVWFQRQRPMGRRRWRDMQAREALRGIPDIVLTTEGRPPLIIDAKFRWTETARRSEEIYKLLGYGENFALARLHGALIFPGPVAGEVVYEKSDGGRLASVVYNGDDDSLSTSLAEVVSAWLAEEAGRVVELAGEDELAAAVAARLDGVQAVAVKVLDTAHRVAAEARLQELLPDAWALFDEDAQAMLITGWALGELFDQSARDWSGPVLALLSACERVIKLRVFDPVEAASPGALELEATFGRMAYWLRKIDQASPASDAILAWATSGGGPDAPALKRLGRAMTKVADLRNKAAHVELVGSDGWDRAVKRVLVGDNALIAQIAATLSPLRQLP